MLLVVLLVLLVAQVGLLHVVDATGRVVVTAPQGYGQVQCQVLKVLQAPLCLVQVQLVLQVLLVLVVELARLLDLLDVVWWLAWRQLQVLLCLGQVTCAHMQLL